MYFENYKSLYQISILNLEHGKYSEFNYIVGPIDMIFYNCRIVLNKESLY